MSKHFFERILYIRLPLWFLLFVLLLFTIGAVMFGALVEYRLAGGTKAESLGNAAVHVAKFPRFVKKVFTQPWNSQILPGYEFSYLELVDSNFDDRGYILVSGYRPEHDISVVYLFSLRERKIVHSWIPPFEQIRAVTPLFNENPDERRYYNAQHPYLLDNGDVIFSSGNGPLVRIDACSNLIWAIDRWFHHAIEMRHDGNFLIPVITLRQDSDNLNYQDDGFAVVSQDGRIIAEYSVLSILEDNGYSGLLYGVGPFEYDRIHLNDAQPMLSSDGYVQEGDVALSVRNLSTVFMYRPNTNEIVWLKTGPWLNQHDVDYLGDGVFSVFGNDVVRQSRKPEYFINGSSQIYLWTPESGKVDTPFRNTMTDILSRTEGLVRHLPNGDAFVEAEFRPMLHRIGRDEIRWRFANTISEVEVGALHWSRYFLPSEVDLAWTQNLTCDRALVTESR